MRYGRASFFSVHNEHFLEKNQEFSSDDALYNVNE